MTNNNHQTSSNNNGLPIIPTKRYFTIGEVSHLCGVKPHVLRYWEQEFTQLKPCKRRGNRRYYQRGDVILVRKIRSLLYEQGYTIGGARQQLSGSPVSKSVAPATLATTTNSQTDIFKNMIAELEQVLAMLTDTQIQVSSSDNGA